MVPAVRPAKVWLHLEARQSRAGPDECLPLLFNFSLDRAPLCADDTDPPGIDLRGPPVLVRTAPAIEVARLAGPGGGSSKGGNYPPNPRKLGLTQESGFCNV